MIDFLIFLFKWIPDIFVHLVLFFGVIGFTVTSFFEGFIPLPLLPQKVLIKYISIAMIAIGLYLEGGMAITNEYLAREKEWNGRVELAETRAREATARVEYVFQDRVQKVKEVQVVVQEKIRDVAITIDKDCKITKDVIDIHNQSARGLK